MAKEVYALRWRYFDGSGGATVRVYTSAAAAETEREFLKDVSGDKEWHVDHVPLVEADNA